MSATPNNQDDAFVELERAEAQAKVAWEMWTGKKVAAEAAWAKEAQAAWAEVVRAEAKVAEAKAKARAVANSF